MSQPVHHDCKDVKIAWPLQPVRIDGPPRKRRSTAAAEEEMTEMPQHMPCQCSGSGRPRPGQAAGHTPAAKSYSAFRPGRSRTTAPGRLIDPKDFAPKPCEEAGSFDRWGWAPCQADCLLQGQLALACASRCACRRQRSSRRCALESDGVFPIPMRAAGRCGLFSTCVL